MVVLVDHTGDPIGVRAKAEVHGLSTPRHLAFSCHVVDGRGRLLVTRRALSKKTWPGVWTNSFCGHPAPDETLEEAVRRRSEFELGLSIDRITCAIPDFAYVARDASGIEENEHCPVFIARATSYTDTQSRRGGRNSVDHGRGAGSGDRLDTMGIQPVAGRALPRTRPAYRRPHHRVGVQRGSGAQ